MQASYRVAPQPPAPTVVVYRGVSLWGLAFVSLGLLALLAGVVFVAVSESCTVTLDMSRPDDTCTITRTYPVYGATVEKHPLSSIRGTRLVVSHGRHHTSSSYALDLTTDGAPIGLSSSFESIQVRSTQRLRIDTFLHGRDPSLHMVYEQGGAGGLAFLLIGILPVGPGPGSGRRRSGR